MESDAPGGKNAPMKLIRAAAWPQDAMSARQASQVNDTSDAADAGARVPSVDAVLTYGCVDWYFYSGSSDRSHEHGA